MCGGVLHVSMVEDKLLEERGGGQTLREHRIHRRVSSQAFPVHPSPDFPNGKIIKVIFGTLGAW